MSQVNNYLAGSLASVNYHTVQIFDGGNIDEFLAIHQSLPFKVFFQ